MTRRDGNDSDTVPAPPSEEALELAKKLSGLKTNAAALAAALGMK